MKNTKFKNIIEDFEFLEDWEDRYRYIIDLGKNLAPMDIKIKNPNTKVLGCASQVWIYPNFRTENQNRLMGFIGDSDSMIVKGLIAVLDSLLDGVPVCKIESINFEDEFKKLELSSNLSAQRSNGLKSMIDRIVELAKKESQL